ADQVRGGQHHYLGEIRLDSYQFRQVERALEGTRGAHLSGLLVEPDLVVVLVGAVLAEVKGPVTAVAPPRQRQHVDAAVAFDREGRGRTAGRPLRRAVDREARRDVREREVDRERATVHRPLPGAGSGDHLAVDHAAAVDGEFNVVHRLTSPCGTVAGR